jgi:hypothetical protein
MGESVKATANLSRFYSTLSPAERVTLHLETKARGDADEADRLTRSCPRRTYEQADAAYADRVELAHDKTAAAVMVILHHLGKIKALRATIDCFNGFAPAWRVSAATAFFDGMHCADGRHADGDTLIEQAKQPHVSIEENEDEAEALLAKLWAVMSRTDAATGRLRELIDVGIETATQDLLDSWTAFGRFSLECVGVDPAAILVGCGFPASLVVSIEQSLSPYPQLTPRDAETTQLVEALSRAWRERFGGR